MGFKENLVAISEEPNSLTMTILVNVRMEDIKSNGPKFKMPYKNLTCVLLKHDYEFQFENVLKI